MIEPRKVEVMDILSARDDRVALQRDFIHRHGCPVISFTMNIPGSIKVNPGIIRAFHLGSRRIVHALESMQVVILEKHEKIAFTGCEGLWAVNAGAARLKSAMTAIEDMDELGRLFDIDVLTADGEKLSRDSQGIERTCLICGGPVRACARSRAHTAAELFDKVNDLIRCHFIGEDARYIARCAQQALLTEAIITPKPGLVDRENSGAHTDMDLFTFVDSACALVPYFEKCARIALENGPEDPARLFKILRYHGRIWERNMFEATHQINTHKGALFSLGILCASAALSIVEASPDAVHPAFSPMAIFDHAAHLGAAALEDFERLNPDRALTAGEQQYVALGRTGARGEAAAGFPSVRNIALPVLETGRAAGLSLNDAALNALIALMADLEDSNVIKRGGVAGGDAVKSAAAHLNMVPTSAPDHAALRHFNQAFTDARLSPGGCADLLAAALFIYNLGR